VSSSSGSTKEQAAEVVDAAKQTAQQQVGDVAEKGRGVVRRQVDQRSTQAGEQASSVAETLRQTASQIRAQGDPQKAPWHRSPTREQIAWSGSVRI
jgi:vacuolar-type H+-ATPase subunit H